MKRIFLFVVTNLAVPALAQCGAFHRRAGVRREPLANGDMVTLGLLQGMLNTFGFMRLFMSHPPLDERIAALQT